MTSLNEPPPEHYNFTRNGFSKEFPDDTTCLDWLWRFLYPEGIFCKECRRRTKHHRIASRHSYSCDYCGHHIHPTQGTIYYRSHIPLKSWFYAVYLVTADNGKISAKQLQRELGVTYKTAWRMRKQIRQTLCEAKDANADASTAQH